MAYHLGVDLGTTFTAAASMTDSGPVMVGLGNRAMQIPSVVFLADGGGVLVGEAADRRSSSDPNRIVREFKRRLGDPVPILVAGRPVSAQYLSARVLRWVVDRAAEELGDPPADVILTYPANWGPFKTDFLRQVAAMADVRPVRTCSEPAAAALEYASKNRVSVGDRIVVYDLGGGTFDVCVLEKTAGGFGLLGHADGLDQLGGIDFDEAVFRLVIGMLPAGSIESLDADRPGLLALHRLRRDCVAAKEALSFDAEVVIPIALPTLSSSVTVTRAAFEDLIKPALAETVQATDRALRSAQTDAAALAAIVLVGGSSRIPLITTTLSTAFRCPIALDTHPKSVVALGAARAATIPGATTTLIAGPTALFVERLDVNAVAPAANRLIPVDPPPLPNPVASEVGELDNGQPEGAYADLSAQANGGFQGGGSVHRRGGAALVVAVVVLVIAVGVAVAVWINRGMTVATGTRPTDADVGSGSVESSTTIGPSGGLLPSGAPLGDEQLVAARLVGDNLDLYVVDTATGTVGIRLTSDPAQERGPVLSPDRRTIVYGLENGASRALRVVGSSGEGDRQLFANQPPECLWMYRPAWNPVRPDELAMTCRDANEDYILRIIRTDGHIIADLDIGLRAVADVSWSPDGGELVFYANESALDNGGAIYVMPADGSSPPIGLIQAGPGSVADPQWSPDGTEIVFGQRRTATTPFDIFVMGADGANVRQLTDHSGQDLDPSWSPDGRQIVFRSEREDGASIDDSRLWIMDQDGSNQRQVLPTDDAVIDTSTAWSRR